MDKTEFAHHNKHMLIEVAEYERLKKMQEVNEVQRGIFKRAYDNWAEWERRIKEEAER